MKEPHDHDSDQEHEQDHTTETHPDDEVFNIYDGPKKFVNVLFSDRSHLNPRQSMRSIQSYAL
jgi:hypothetical protein